MVQWLAKEVHPARYFTFDDPTVLGAAQDDPAGFLTGVRGPMVLDEVQRVPALFPVIKAAVDRDRQPGRSLLTGSADVLLVPRLAETLGRVELLTLWPFSQGELVGLKKGFVDALFDAEFPDLDVGVGRHKDILGRVLVPEAVRRSEAKRIAGRRGWAHTWRC